MIYFEYGQKEMDYLTKKDKKLGAVINNIGIINREINPDAFSALTESIISQQISGKAAQTVYSRLKNLLVEITPENICAVDTLYIKNCGMSERKAKYIKEAAEAAVCGKICFDELHTMSDEAVITSLTSLNGVGMWTAEMLLIFSLSRKNIISYKDLAIRKGIMKLYNKKELSQETFDYYKKRYSPYASVASLYLWAMSLI